MSKFEIMVPQLPCGRLPAYCTKVERHPAHDHGPMQGPRAGELFWHCYGLHASGANTPDAVLDDCGGPGKISS